MFPLFSLFRGRGDGMIGSVASRGASRSQIFFQIILAHGVNIWKLAVIVYLLSDCPAAQQHMKGGYYAT